MNKLHLILLTLLFTISTETKASSIILNEKEFQTVSYMDNSNEQVVKLEGFITHPKVKGKHPGVLVIHDWMGISDFTKLKLQELSKLGYVAFAADIYGKEHYPKSTEEAGKIAGSFKDNRGKLRKRAQLALEKLLKDPSVDPNRIAVIGFCFGGTTALELARSGAKLKGVVSFHGGLSTPHPEDAKNIKAEILALHGADDPSVPEKEVQAFEVEMRAAKVKWELVKYGNAVHAFTNPLAGNDNSKGAAYNAEADRKSWVAMKNFFDYLFK